MANKGLNDAKKAKKDEFYTQLSDIENELRHYKEHFRGKTVLCNCDDPRVSNFFPLIQTNKLWLGYGFRGGAAHFISRYEDTATAGNHKAGMIRVSGVVWFTNLEIKKRHEELILFRNYTPEAYPHYANYDAIDVPQTDEIPSNYNGLMGVPISFMDRYNPEQFEIVGNACDTAWCRKAGIAPMGKATIDQLRKQGNMAHVTANMNSLYLIQDGKIVLPYARIIIRRRVKEFSAV